MSSKINKNNGTSCRDGLKEAQENGMAIVSPLSPAPPRLGFPFERHSNQEFKKQGFKREYAQIKLAIWWRRVREKHLKKTVLQQLVVAQKAAGTIEARMCLVHDPGVCSIPSLCTAFFVVLIFSWLKEGKTF